MKDLYFQVNSRCARACICTTLGACLLRSYYIRHGVGSVRYRNNSLSTWPCISPPILPLTKSGAPDSPGGAVTSPVSELEVYKSSPSSLEEFPWSPSGSSPIRFAKMESRKTKGRQDLDNDSRRIFHLLHQNKNKCFHSGSNLFFFPPMRSQLGPVAHMHFDSL